MIDLKTVLIDYDDTLHDSNSKFVAKFGPPASALGLDGRGLWGLWLFEVHREIVHRRFPERHDDYEFHCELLFKKLGKPYDDTIAEQIVNGYKAAMEECWTTPSFFGDAFKFLDRAADGNKLCLSTAEHAMEKANCVARFGNRRYFDHVFGDHVINAMKTEPEYYREALRLSGSAPGETVSIGDSLMNDILPAKLVGIKTIWVNRGNERAPKGSKPDHEVGDLLESLKYVQ